MRSEERKSSATTRAPPRGVCSPPYAASHWAQLLAKTYTSSHNPSATSARRSGKRSSQSSMQAALLLYGPQPRRTATAARAKSAGTIGSHNRTTVKAPARRVGERVPSVRGEASKTSNSAAAAAAHRLPHSSLPTPNNAALAKEFLQRHRRCEVGAGQPPPAQVSSRGQDVVQSSRDLRLVERLGLLEAELARLREDVQLAQNPAPSEARYPSGVSDEKPTPSYAAPGPLAQAPAYAANPLRSAQACTISLFPDAKAGARVDDENGLKNAARPLQELESTTRASEGTSFPNHNSETPCQSTPIDQPDANLGAHVAPAAARHPPCTVGAHLHHTREQISPTPAATTTTPQGSPSQHKGCMDPATELGESGGQDVVNDAREEERYAEGVDRASKIAEMKARLRVDVGQAGCASPGAETPRTLPSHSDNGALTGCSSMSRLLRENRNWLADHDLASPAVDVSSVATDPSTSSTRKRAGVVEKLDFTCMDAAVDLEKSGAFHREETFASVDSQGASLDAEDASVDAQGASLAARCDVRSNSFVTLPQCQQQALDQLLRVPNSPFLPSPNLYLPSPRTFKHGDWGENANLNPEGAAAADAEVEAQRRTHEGGISAPQDSTTSNQGGTSASLSPLSSAARYTIAEAGGSNTIPLLMEMQDDLQVVCEDLRGDVSPTRLMRIGRRWEEARVRQAPPGVKLRRSKSESSLSVVLALVDNYLPTDNPKDSFKDTPSQVSSSLRAASCDIDRPEYLSAPTPGAAAFRPPQLYSSRANCNPTPPIPPPATQAGAERGEGAGVHGEAGHFRPRYSLNMSEKDRVARQRFIDAQRRHVQATRQWILGQTENAILQETRPEYATLARPHCSLPARHLGGRLLYSVSSCSDSTFFRPVGHEALHSNPVSLSMDSAKYTDAYQRRQDPHSVSSHPPRVAWGLSSILKQSLPHFTAERASKSLEGDDIACDLVSDTKDATCKVAFMATSHSASTTHYRRHTDESLKSMLCDDNGDETDEEVF